MHLKSLRDVFRHMLLMSRVLNFALGVETMLLKCIFAVVSPTVLEVTFQFFVVVNYAC